MMSRLINKIYPLIRSSPSQDGGGEGVVNLTYVHEIYIQNNLIAEQYVWLALLCLYELQNWINSKYHRISEAIMEVDENHYF